MILFWSKYTCSKVCEGAGRVVGFVEVDENFVLRFNICDEVTACRIGYSVFAGVVPEADEVSFVIFFVEAFCPVSGVKV